ncbi:MAG: TadE/TadG family type IV pilus assembly protein [Pirellulaceae bacterium]
MIKTIIRHHRRGVAAVELAIVLPILLLALVGIIEFGRAVMVQQIITNAAREGARRAIIPGAKSSTALSLVNTYLDNTSVHDAGGRVVRVEDINGTTLLVENAPTKSPIVVLVSVPYDQVSFGLGIFLGGTTLSARVTMRKE